MVEGKSKQVVRQGQTSTWAGAGKLHSFRLFIWSSGAPWASDWVIGLGVWAQWPLMVARCGPSQPKKTAYGLCSLHLYGALLGRVGNHEDTGSSKSPIT